MLEQDEEDKAPFLEQMTEETKNQVEKIDRGSLVLVCEFPVEGNGPQCYLELVGWRGAHTLRVYVQKHDRLHYLRLCGMDLSKYGSNRITDFIKKIL